MERLLLDTFSIIFGVAFISAFIWGVARLLRLYDYQLEPDGLTYTYRHRVPLKRVLYTDILEVEEITTLDELMDPWRGTMGGFRGRAWRTRLFTYRSVLVRHRDGRVILLTPPAPESFATELRRRSGLERAAV